ncbi:serine hydrolase domain-containing protein [Sphingomonas canadensis]|nr:serine hydrolase [Sphingomonas canadensis]
MIRRLYPAIAAALLLTAHPAAAQQQPSAYTRSIAAGYKALMLCGAIFNAGRTQAQAEALELTGIYPEYDAIVPTLKASVRRFLVDPAMMLSGVQWRGDGDPRRRAYWSGEVIVPFDDRLPPRVATWYSGIGCTIHRLGRDTGYTTGAVDWTDDRPLNPGFGSLDDRPWPIGEGGIGPRTLPALEAPIARALEGGFGGRTTGVLIVQNGRIVGERYAEGFGPHVSQRTWSVAKSIAGTLIGIANGQNLITPATGSFLPTDDDRGRISVDQLLRMASGLRSIAPGNRTDDIYFGGTTVDEEGTFWPIEALPGTRFRYANLDTLLAVRALRKALGDDNRYHRLLETDLFARLGMTRTVAEGDIAGNYVLSSQVWSTARDLARLGLLWLNDGVWQGKRILPEGWMKYMTSPSGPQPPNNPGWGYGATLWLADASTGLPPGSYAAQGNRGQYILVIPAHGLVIVRRGEDRNGTAFDISAFGRAVVAALP